MIKLSISSAGFPPSRWSLCHLGRCKTLRLILKLRIKLLGSHGKMPHNTRLKIIAWHWRRKLKKRKGSELSCMGLARLPPDGLMARWKKLYKNLVFLRALVLHFVWCHRRGFKILLKNKILGFKGFRNRSSYNLLMLNRLLKCIWEIKLN